MSGEIYLSSNIYKKLAKMRESINKEQYYNFSELLEAVNRKAKYYKVLPLYSYLEGMATLTVVDLDDIKSSVTFKVPADMVDVKNAKAHIYGMAFDVEEYKSAITPLQYNRLLEKMAKAGVTDEEIMERYKVDSLAGMTQDVYQRCMNVLEKMKNKEAT